MTILKKIFITIFAFGSFLALEASSHINTIQKSYEKPLRFLESVSRDTGSDDYEAMASVFSCFNESFSKVTKLLQNDIRAMNIAAKKDGNAQALALHDQLKELLALLKRHKLIYEAIFTHKAIRKSYQQLFDLIDNDEDVIDYIDKHREEFHIQDVGNNYLHVLLKNVKSFSRQISKYEDYVHSNYVDLKMQNYVLKIELLKLRNAILFSKQYKL